MKRVWFALLLAVLGTLSISSCRERDYAGEDSADDQASSGEESADGSARGSEAGGRNRDSSTVLADAADSQTLDAANAQGPSDGGSRVDGGVTPEGGTRDGADGEVAAQADSGSTTADAASDDGGATCGLPNTFQWSGGGPLAPPKNGWLSMKDVTHVFHNDVHILYFTTFQTGWGAGMMTFKSWREAAAAPQMKMGFGVAPTLFYFSPKKLWVLAYQWGANKFSYRTSDDPANPSGWSAEKSLYRTALPPGGTGPIDQTVICDRAKCYLYYAADNGHIYNSAMPIANFPGEFPAATDSGIVGTTQNLFEAVQVYKVRGADKYLMIVEAQGSARYFRAFTATSLDGPWDLLTNEFAVKKSVSLTPNWTNDISHGDLVRSNPDETFTIDPCNLQMVFQGRDPSVDTEYGKLPYRLGLITLKR